MSNTKKNIVYSLILVAVIGAVWVYRNYIQTPSENFSEHHTNQVRLFTVQGKTMGTTYTIKYLNTNDLELKNAIDSLLEIFNQSLSTYIATSEISQFNQRDSFVFELPYFYPVLQKSAEIYGNTSGEFDPTVMPLVNAWGFGPQKRSSMPQNQVDSLLSLIGFPKIKFDYQGVRKTVQNVQLDFSALAKGYGVDVVAEFLKAQGLAHYLIEIGGEMIAQGQNEKGKIWVVGIDNPTSNLPQNQLSSVVTLENRAIATSGNYRNFYIKDGKKYAHTISPKTGYPIMHNLLSASVFAPDCMTADGYATAFMVMGVEKTKEIVQKYPEIDVFLIYEKNEKLETFASEGIRKYLKVVP